jgi:Domain of unknown function (DUF4203)
VNVDHINFAPVAQILAGLALLFFGRKLFWLFVGVIGFLAGMEFGAEIVKGQPQGMILLLSIGIGLLAAFLAIFLQRLVVAVAGGLAGGMLAMRIAVMLGASTESLQWIVFLAGALLAAILVSAVFDWALIGLSALVGASLVSEALPFDQAAQFIGIVVLFVLGLLVQTRMFGFIRT